MMNHIRTYFLEIKNEYIETRSHPREDFLEWFIQRKMTWGMRWGLVILLMFVVQPMTYYPRVSLVFFYIGLALLIVYLCGQLFFLLTFIYRRLTRR